MILRWLLNALAMVITAYVFPRWIGFSGAFAVLVAAFVLGIVNAIIRPILLVLTLPLNIVTLGLFTFVVNALMLLLVAALVPGFAVHGFWSAVFASIVISIVSAVLSGVVRH